jgi:hypothetical protein
MDLGEVGWGGGDWIGLAQDRDMQKALVNAVMNLRSHKMLGNYRAASQLVASRAVVSLAGNMEGRYWQHCDGSVETWREDTGSTVMDL